MPLGATDDDCKQVGLQPDGRSAFPVAPLVGCAKRATEYPGDLGRCPFLECVFKHELTLKEKCPLGKKNLAKLPNG